MLLHIQTILIIIIANNFCVQWYLIQSAMYLSAINLFDLLDRNLYATINQEAKRISRESSRDSRREKRAANRILIRLIRM